VSRWKPDAFGRLRDAALDLFLEQGFEQTTVEQIAARAGLTKRTFFRYFADKREVLFAGGEDLNQAFADAVAAAPQEAAPLEAAAAALDAAGAIFEQRRPFARRRQQAIAGSVELQERELVKLASLSAAVADALRERGVEAPVAALAAETAIAVFKVAFERWVAPEQAPGELSAVIREALGELRAVAAAS
jgi:AcrR family transcriptional regulator